MAILENLFLKGTHPWKFCTSIYSSWCSVFSSAGGHKCNRQFCQNQNGLTVSPNPTLLGLKWKVVKQKTNAALFLL